MTNEIKEILEDVKRHLDYVEATKQVSIRDNEMKAMYDYITNLQERIDKAVELLKEAGCYDEKAKIFCDDVWEELPELLDILRCDE